MGVMTWKWHSKESKDGSQELEKKAAADSSGAGVWQYPRGVPRSLSLPPLAPHSPGRQADCGWNEAGGLDTAQCPRLASQTQGSQHKMAPRQP